jgi:hypothetical protein
LKTFLLAALLAVIASLEPRAALASSSTGAFHVTAKKIAFYSNRYVITADGDVHVTLSDGTDLRGSTFQMDLRLNYFVLGGDVKLAAGGASYDGAGFSEFFDFDRGYFIPYGDEPDRWTFSNGDYKNILRGREMPGDAFFFPDLSKDRVFLYASSATIDPHQSVRFAPANINFGLSFVQFPSYFLNFSPNPNFAANSLTGAIVDGPLDFAGGRHSLETLHLRYDSLNKAYFSYEQHLVSDNSYVAASINPLTRPQKDYNVFAYGRVGPKFNAEADFQEFTFQHDFSRPLSAGAYLNLRATLGLGHAFLQFNGDQYYASLLAQPAPGLLGDLYYGDPTHNWVPNHQNDASLTLTVLPHQIKLFPVNFRARASYGQAHDGISPLVSLSATGLPSLTGQSTAVNFPTIFTTGLGATAYTNPLTIYRYGNERLTTTAIYDRQFQFFSFPHHIDTTTTTVSLTDVYGTKFAAFLAYQIINTRDLYNSPALQNQVYPTGYIPISPLNGQAYPDWGTFTGQGTRRSLTESLIYTPTPFFNGTLTFRENKDFPQPIPYPQGYQGLQLDYTSRLLGLVNAPTVVGVAPYQGTLDLRFHIAPTLTLDVSRSYFFNFGGYYRWQNGFGFQISK